MPAPSKQGAENFQPRIIAKTASYTVTTEESSCWFTNRGATVAITFTLPAVTNPTIPIGTNFTFYGISATGFTVASNGSLDNILAPNDATADSLTTTTTSLIIGASVTVRWDGTSWLSVRGAGNTFVTA